MRNLAKSSKNRSDRRGLAAVETAFALPLIVILTFATLDICDGIFLQQKAEIAAHEGARAAIMRGASIDTVHNAVETYLDSRDLVFTDIETVVSSSVDPEAADVLDPITVTVQIGLAGNRRMPLSPFQYINGPNIIAEVTMYKEYP